MQMNKTALRSIDPDMAISELESIVGDSKDRRFFVDFDFTLCGQSSVDIFLAQASPASLYMPIFKAFAFILRGLLRRRSAKHWHDPARVAIALLICPWLVVTFRKQAEKLFATYQNRQLIGALDDVPVEKIVIVTFGLEFIVKALLAGTRLKDAQLVAPSLFSAARYRRIGKLEVLRRANIAIDPDRDVVITDCDKDDADILAYVQNPYFIEWPACAEPNPINAAYIPFYYLARIKRSPGFLVKQVFLDEMVVVLLLFSLVFIPGDWTVPASLVLFFLSYLVVYEIGYADNDLVGYRREAAPKLSARFYETMGYVNARAAWVWSLVFAFCGVAILSDGVRAGIYARAGMAVPDSRLLEIGLLLLGWMVCVVIGYLLFRGFNRAPLFWRVYLYIPLQISKLLSPVIFFALTPVAAVLFMAHLVRMWAPYAIRRCGGDIEATSSQTIRLAFFLAFLPLLVVLEGNATFLWNWEVAVIGAFCLLRAIPELRRKAVYRW